MPDARLDVLCIGNAIVDVIANASDEFLAQEGLVKGSMRLIDAEEAERLYAHMGPAHEVSGGSAGAVDGARRTGAMGVTLTSNRSMRILSWLGNPSASFANKMSIRRVSSNSLKPSRWRSTQNMSDKVKATLRPASRATSIARSIA